VFWAKNQNKPYTPVFPVHARADKIMEQIKRAKQIIKCIKKQDKQINSRVKIISHQEAIIEQDRLNQAKRRMMRKCREFENQFNNMEFVINCTWHT
jgi:uncharacterized protein YllA (UPF0747 family)